MAKHNLVGKIGENIASRWLTKNGFSVFDKNYRKRWGEIDIVARGTGSKFHFIEVKAVSYETKDELRRNVSRETWRPEEKVHREKLRRLSRAAETWLMEHDYSGDWQIDVVTVRMVPREKYAQVQMIEGVILE